MAEKKKLITSGRLPIDLRGGEEWLDGGVSFKPGMHRFVVEGFEDTEARQKKTPMYALVLGIISGPDDSEEDAKKTFRRNFTIGSDEALNFFRGMSAKLLGEGWRGDALDDEGTPDVARYIGIEFDAMIVERSWNDDKGQSHPGWDVQLRTAENVTLPAKKATNVRRPTR